jgi:hypothetical protein
MSQDYTCFFPPFLTRWKDTLQKPLLARWIEGYRFLLCCERDAASFHLHLGPETEWHQQAATLPQAFPRPRAAVSYILDTCPIVKRKDEEEFVRYRSEDPILESYDALAECQRTGQSFVSPPTCAAATR